MAQELRTTVESRAAGWHWQGIPFTSASRRVRLYGCEHLGPHRGAVRSRG